MPNIQKIQKDTEEQSQPLTIVAPTDALQSLTRLCDLVATGKRSYDDVAEQIEDKAYELCEAETDSLEQVVHQLNKLAHFFEYLSDKNEEQCRDLADVYLLIGQIHQFAGKFVESIPWFLRSAVVDDRYPAPFHSLATSYSQLHEYDDAVKSLEQEILLSPGNYYSYLLLADLYEREERPEAVEGCLKRLLERNPENIQGLHSLIRHYEQTDAAINTTLLKRRLLGGNKTYNRIEAVIRCFYLCSEGKYTQVIDFLDKWQKNANGVTITYLVKAYVYSELGQFTRRRQALTDFKVQNHGREDVMVTKLREFGSIFGDTAASELKKLLLLPPPKA